MKQFILRCNGKHFASMWAEEMKIEERSAKHIKLIIKNQVIFSKVIRNNVEVFEEDGITVINADVK